MKIGGDAPAACGAAPNSATGPSKMHEGDEYADGQKGDELDDQFRRDRQHQAVLMLGGVGMAGAEQHREHRHGQRDQEGAVAEQRRRNAPVRTLPS